MTLDELSKTLPNGFHDARVTVLQINYAQREVTIGLNVWIGDLSSADHALREAYRPGLLKFSGLLFCAIEPPDPRFPYQKAEAITVGSGSVATLNRPPTFKLPDETVAGSTNWFFVYEWNAFIYVSAEAVSLDWHSENA